MLAPTKRAGTLAKARQLLAQRRRRRRSPRTWEQRRKAAGDRRPLSCPRCGRRMEYWLFLFGSAYEMAELVGVEVDKKFLQTG